MDLTAIKYMKNYEIISPDPGELTGDNNSTNI